MERRITVFDTTLRDGEQSVGIALTPDQKVAVALQLERAGVDIVEAGFPAASDGEMAGVRAVADAMKGPVVAGMARANTADIDAAATALERARRSRVHIVLATSPIHLERKLRLTEAEVVALAVRTVAYAHERFDEVEFCCEDASRTPLAFLVRICTAVIDAGADVVNLPDTVGYAVPEDYADIFVEVRAACPTATLSAHCHNDLGLGVANTLAAVAAGASQVECTVNGLGERAGNVALEEVVAALAHHRDTVGVVTGVDVTQLRATSELVSELTGYPLSPQKPVVGTGA
jgi:2-isopropylmalate synthase